MVSHKYELGQQYSNFAINRLTPTKYVKKKKNSDLGIGKMTQAETCIIRTQVCVYIL